MLDNLRNFGRSWIAKVLLGILIVSVAGFGIPSVFLDLNANTVARVGDQNISVRDFSRIYNAQLNQFAQQTGQMPTGEQAMAYGLPGAALNRLANDAALAQLAQRLDLGASDARLAQLVRQDPAFAGALGTFDRDSFVSVLRQAGYSETEYLNLQRRTAMREQIGAMFEGVALPDVALDIANAYANNRRTVDYVTLNPVLYTVSEEPSEAELATFFEENQSLFRTGETRRVRLLPLTPAALAENIEISEDAISAEYERTIDRYVSVERRTITQVPLASDENIALFEQGAADGRGFEDLVAEADLADEVVDLGSRTRAEMTDPALVEAAFGLTEGDFTLIEGPAGQRAVWVSQIEPAGTQPLEEVRDEIARDLALEEARALYLDAYDAIEEARAAFLPVDEVAAQYGLDVYELELTRSGDALSEVDDLPDGADGQVAQSIFSASEDANITPAITLGADETVFFELLEVVPARDQTLEEARSEAVAAWQELQTDMAMTETAEGMVSQLDAGSDIFALAAEQGLVPQASQPFGRQGTDDGAIGPDVARSAFMGPEGHAGYATTPNGDVVVFQVTDVIEADVSEPSNVSQAVAQGFADTLSTGFVAGLRTDLPMRINQEALNALVGLE
ncbi:peptidylprolyl isomerase [Pelagibacterium xiamenense]|uniref:peptidylprolyl isomerase n=1 Tax=Pelagibacterium xiamenense TaxID=2901140 RepID=UPI001E335050|nr:peptidylprolyl isomerase [Pelagibacterium xiamenense]MCD7060942.1 SurA N-terminal domain-containing protein [Pelagibacterium xiamenense]